MAHDALADTSISSTEPSSTSSLSTSHFFPFAASPDIIRSHEKDNFVIAGLITQAQSIIRSFKGARFAHAHVDAIRNLTEILYFSLTTLIGNRTLGEEYCDIVQLEDDTLQLPSFARRAGYIASSVLAPWLLQWVLPALRRTIRTKLERRIATNDLKEPRSKRSLMALRCRTYILEHLDSLTSLSPIYALSLAIFYFTGSYYHLSKRLWGLRYVFTRRIGENEQRVGYEVLGTLLALQMAVQCIMHVRQTVESLQAEEVGSIPTSKSLAHKEKAFLSSIQHPPSALALPASAPRYDLTTNTTAMPWIPAGQQRKCTLCLELFKDPSVTTCGHVFCWTCVRDWVQEKPECPLCRQEVLASKILPLRG